MSKQTNGVEWQRHKYEMGKMDWESAIGPREDVRKGEKAYDGRSSWEY